MPATPSLPGLEPPPRLCAATGRHGRPCRNRAGADGWCHRHRPPGDDAKALLAALDSRPEDGEHGLALLQRLAAVLAIKALSAEEEAAFNRSARTAALLARTRALLTKAPPPEDLSDDERAARLAALLDAARARRAGSAADGAAPALDPAAGPAEPGAGE